jgi:hypothetical protein
VDGIMGDLIIMVRLEWITPAVEVVVVVVTVTVVKVVMVLLFVDTLFNRTV